MAQGASMNNNLLLNAANTRNQAIGSAMSYSPLQTGGTNTQYASGLGTWLPQVLATAGGAAQGGLGAASAGTSILGGMIGGA